MAFLRDDEFILLMDTPLISGRMLSVDELKALRDVGIQTAYWAGPIWDDFWPDEHRLPKWEYFDDYLERMRQADLKCIIPLWHKQSVRFPAEYYIKRNRGYVMRALSPWNPAAQEKSNRLLKMVRDQLTSPTCQIVSGQLDGGERVLLNEPAYFDSYALADWRKSHTGMPDYLTPEGDAWLRDSYTRLLMSQQEILVDTQHHEIWCMLSRFKAIHKAISCHGCEYIDDYLAAFHALKPTSINHISFNYFPYGPTFYPVIAHEQQAWHVNEFVGAEYCEGLKAGNGRLAYEQGLRGLIVGPTHPYTRHMGIESWMLDAIKETQKLFELSARPAKGKGGEKVFDWGAQSGQGLPHEKKSQCEESG